jgi:hypothetical protein
MVFPQNVLHNKVEIYYDGAWHDITTDDDGTSRVRGTGAQDGEITIEARGEPDEATALQPTIGRLSINNRDGKFSPRNASSDLYGKIGANTQLRIATDRVSTKSIVDDFSDARANTWGVSNPSGHTWTNVGGNQSDYDTSGGLGTHAHQANAVLHTSAVLTTLDGDPLEIIDFDFVVLGVAITGTPTGEAVQCGIRARLGAFEPDYVEGRLWFTTGGAVQYNMRYVINYSEIAFTSFPTISGATPTGGTSYRFQAQGGKLRMKAWAGSSAASEPSAWGLELDTTVTNPGWFFLFSICGGANTNVKPFVFSHADINASLGVVLASLEVVEWPKKWDSTGNDVWVSIVATGITRRLRQGNRPIRSPLYRYYTRDLADLSLGTVQTSIQHYWPMEGLAQQTRLIRDEIGDVLMRFDVATHNNVEWGSNDFLVGSGKLVTITGLPVPEGVVVVPFISSFDLPSGGTLPEPDVADPDTFTFSCWFYWPPLLEDFPFIPATSLYFSFRVPDSPIGNIFVDVQYRPLTAEFDVTLDSTSGDVADTGTLPFTDTPHLLIVDWFVDGADLWTVDVYIDNTVVASDSASFRPFVHMDRFDIETEPYSPVTLGHLTFETGTLFTRTLSFRNNIYEAGQGFPGETAVERFIRLCETEGVAYEVFTDGDLDISFPTLMGPQRPGNFIDHLDDISRADGGVIYELRTPFGYGFRTRQSLYGVPDGGYALTLDYTNTDLGEVPNVTDDDQKTRNIIRAKLRGGTQGETSYVITSGPLGTEAIGEYEDGGIEVALNDTDQLADWVTWAGFLGTWDEDRWPELVLHLHRTPFTSNVGKFVDALLLEIGQLLLIQNPPVWVSPDGVIQQMRAVSVLLSNFNLSLTYTLLPGGPYGALGQLNNTDADRADIENCYLVGAIDDNDTLLLATTYMTQTPFDTPLWTRDPAEYDMWGHQGMSLRINPASREGGLGGERVELGVVHPVSDTFTRSGSQLAGTNADTGQTWVNTLGTATDTVLNGSAAVSTHTAANTSCWHSIPVADVDMSLSATVTFNFTTATGAAFFVDVLLRQVDTTNNYRVRLNIDAASSTVFMNPFVTLGGVVTHLTNVSIGSNVAGTPIHVKASIFGRTLHAKAWFDGTDEPDWIYVGHDVAREAINGTDAGIRSGRLTGNTNTDPSATWDNVRIHTPKIRPVFWDRFARTVLNSPSTSFPDDGTGTGYDSFYSGTSSADVDFTPNQLQITGSAAPGYAAIFQAGITYLDAVASVSWTAPLATGANLEPCNIMMRGTTISSYVLFRAIVTVDQQIFGQIFDAAGNFLGQCYVPPDAHTATRVMRMKAACFSTQLMMKIWDPIFPEPVAWQLVVTDPAPVSGWIGLRAGRAGGNTNASAAMVFYDYKVENPQKLTVVRGANGVSRGWDAGSSVKLWSPMILGR